MKYGVPSLKKFKFLVLAGDGINCERESGLAFESVGLDYDTLTVNKLTQNPKYLLNFDGLCLPGGFSFGDELGSGQVLALKLAHGLGNELKNFVERQSPIIGICNGFQVLTKLGLLPKPFQTRQVTLTFNNSENFINKWQTLTVEKDTKCHWLSSCRGSDIELPIRHGEGRIVLKDPSQYESMFQDGLIALRYAEKNPNGSYQAIAGLTDPTGTILGLMPHPEAAIKKSTSIDNFQDCSSDADGKQLFQNIKQYLEERQIESN